MDDPCCPQETLDFEAQAERCEVAACDPTLEACCRRDLQQAAMVARLKAQLSLHDCSKDRLRIAARVLSAAPPPARAAAESGSDLDSEEGDEDEDVARLRAARMQELQAAAQRKAAAQAEGRGTVGELLEARLVREAARCTGVMVCHLALTGSPLDDELDEHLASLALRFMGTRFARCAITPRSTLHLRLRTTPGPGLLCFRDGSLVGAAGLDCFGAPECLLEEAVDKWLRQHKALLLEPDSGSGSRQATAAAAAAAGRVGSQGSSDDEAEEEEDWQQPCEVCGRRYPHQHIRSAYAGGQRGSGSEDSDSD